MGLGGLGGSIGISGTKTGSIVDWARMPKVLQRKKIAIESALLQCGQPDYVFGLLSNAVSWLDGTEGYLSGSGVGALWNSAIGPNASSLTANNFAQEPGLLNNVSRLAYYRWDLTNCLCVIGAYKQPVSGQQTYANVVSARAASATAVPNSPGVGNNSCIGSSGGGNGLVLGFYNYTGAPSHLNSGTVLTTTPPSGAPSGAAAGTNNIAAIQQSTGTHFQCIGADSGATTTRIFKGQIYSLLALPTTPTNMKAIMDFLNIYHNLEITIAP